MGEIWRKKREGRERTIARINWQYNSSDHVGQQLDAGEGLENIAVLCLPREEGEELEGLLRAGERVVLEDLFYFADPETRALRVPPDAVSGQRLRFMVPLLQ